MAQLSTLQEKEQEYRRLNEEMEHKTAVLMQEAEHMLKKHEALLTDKPKVVDPVTDTSRTALEMHSIRSHAQAPEMSMMAAVDINIAEDVDIAPADAGGFRSRVQRRVLMSASDKKSNIEETDEGVVTTVPKSAPSSRKLVPVDDEYADNSAIPASAGQMSVEAQLRFYKAKVRVLQEELDRSQHELNLRIREADATTSKVQQADEERNRLTRQVASLQQTLTKQKKLAEDSEARATALERTLEAVRRDAESAKRDNKKATSEKSAHEVRLNRALEEVDHFRQELAKARASAKDVTNEESRRSEKLANEVRRLERQRSELIAAFKKSLKLIDVLKRQKLHLEAARLLQFREEEFVRALDWDRQTAPNLPTKINTNLHSVASSNRSKPAPGNSSRCGLPSSSNASAKNSANQSARNIDLVVEGNYPDLHEVVQYDNNGNDWNQE